MKKRKRKTKTIQGVMAFLLFISMRFVNMASAYAMTAENDAEIFKGTEADSSQNTEVLYSRSASYSVTIPRAIFLGTDKQGTYSVRVEGDIASDNRVYVSPVDDIADTEVTDFYMKDQSVRNPKADVPATVTQGKFYWDFEEVADSCEETRNSVTAEGLTAGSWRGTFQFEIRLEKDLSAHEHSYAETVTREPTCTEAGEKTYVCDCGDSCVKRIPAGHSYVNDICTSCGKRDAYAVAPEGEIDDWLYTLDTVEKTVVLQKYLNEEKTDAVVYGSYPVGKVV